MRPISTVLIALSLLALVPPGGPALGQAGGPTVRPAVKPVEDVVEALRRGGLAVQKGQAQVNGARFDAYAVQSESATLADSVAAVKEALQGGSGTGRTSKFTITEDPAAHGVVLVAWDLRSEMCPTCTPASPDRLQDLFDGATVLTILPLPMGGTLAMASSAGALLRASSGKGVYQGAAVKAEVKDWRIDLQSSFAFGGASQHTHTAWTSASQAQVEASLRSGLEREGFRRVSGRAGDAASVGADSGSEGTLYSRDGMAFSYVAQADPAGGTVVSLYESTVPK